MDTKSSIKPIFFLDRTHGRRTSKLLASVGISVVLHHKWFLDEAPDPEWIAKCGQQNWVILTGDKSIETVPENRQAVIDCACKVFFFDDSNSLPEEWAAAVIVGRIRVFDLIENNNGPFFVTISKFARGHISGARFAGSGGPKPIAVSVTEETQAAPSAQVQPPPLTLAKYGQFELWPKK
jgi:hypothetical protein